MSKIVIIAEIGHNFNGDMNKAKDLIRTAKYTGCDIAKFQLYDIDTIKKPGDTNYDELKASQVGYNEMWVLKKWCDDYGIEFMCSVFDKTRLGWYLQTEPKRIKLAQRSFMNNDLFYACADTGLPLIASRPPDFVPSIFSKVDGEGVDLSILWCMSRREILQHGIVEFPEKFQKYIADGFSDHTIGTKWAKKAIWRGATIIEKHLTYDLNAPGWDQPSSADYDMMQEIVNTARAQEKK